MRKEDQPRKILKSFVDRIPEDFFGPDDLVFLQGIAMDIKPTEIRRLKNESAGIHQVSLSQMRNYPYKLRSKFSQLKGSQDYSSEVVGLLRAYDLGLIKAKEVGKRVRPLTQDEKRVLALTAVGLRREIVAKRLGLDEMYIDQCKDNIVDKYQTNTIFPVLLKAWRELRRRNNV